MYTPLAAQLGRALLGDAWMRIPSPGHCSLGLPGRQPSLQTVRDFLHAFARRQAPEGSAPVERTRTQRRAHLLPLGTFLLTVLLRHLTVEACLAELGRNRPCGNSSALPARRTCPRVEYLPLPESPGHRAAPVADPGDVRHHDPAPGPTRAGPGAKDSRGLHRLGRPSPAQQRPGRAAGSPAGGRKEYTDQDGKVTRSWSGWLQAPPVVDIHHEVV